MQSKEHRLQPDDERMIHLRLQEKLHKRLRIQVAEEDTSIQEWVTALIKRELDGLDSVKSEKRK